VLHKGETWVSPLSVSHPSSDGLPSSPFPNQIRRGTASGQSAPVSEGCSIGGKPGFPPYRSATPHPMGFPGPPPLSPSAEGQPPDRLRRRRRLILTDRLRYSID